MSDAVNTSQKFAHSDSREHMKIKQIWRQSRKSVLLAALVAAGYGIGFAALAVQLPSLSASERLSLGAFPPRTLPDIVALRDLTKRYAASFPVHVALSYCMIYVSMQTFAIPGTLSLSLLAGALYGTVPGLTLVSVISTLGAAACYGMSWMCGKELVQAMWPDKLAYFGRQVASRKASLLSYIVLLRVTPVLPNTFINVASPMVDVPLPPFMLGTLLGCLPNNFVAVSAGSKLGELQSLKDLYDRKLLLLGLAVGGIALLPILLKQTSSKKVPSSVDSNAADKIQKAD